MKTSLTILTSVALGFCAPLLGFELFGLVLGSFEPPDSAYRAGSQFFPLLRLLLLFPLTVAVAYVIMRLAPRRIALMGSLASAAGLLALAIEFFAYGANEVLTLADIPRAIWPEATPLLILPFVSVVWRRRAA